MPAASCAGDCVDPGVSNTMVLQQRTSQVVDTSRVDTQNITAGGSGSSRPKRAKRSRSRSCTPPRQYRKQRKGRKTDRERSPYRRKPRYSDSDDSYSSSDHGRYSRKRHRSPSVSRSPRSHRRPRRDSAAFMAEMKDLMSSMIGEQLRAALPAATVPSARVTTTAANVSGYGVATQSSAMIGGSPMAAASHPMGDIDTQVASQEAMVSQEPYPPVEEAEHMVSDIESEAPLPEQREEVPASFMGALEAVYKYLPENICPIPPLPPARVMSLYEADAPPVSPGRHRLPFSPTVAGLVSNLEVALTKVKGNKARATPVAFKNANAGRKYYVPHNHTWPVKPPTLDKDAGLVGVRNQGYPDKGTVKLITSLDEGLRTIVAMGSHIDLCLGAARQAISNPDDLDSLLQSSARASKHILGTALGLSTDILLIRRDLAAGSSSVLPGPGRDTLRTAPLGAETLFGGRCLEVSASDLQDRQRRHLAKVPSTTAPRTSRGGVSGYRRPAFRS